MTTPTTTNNLPSTDIQYKAFISYSHSDNRQTGRKWADWLHHSLETYEIPSELIGQTNQYGQAIPSQIYPIFQDEKELSANNDLSASLQQALAQSEFLIYLSSPRSARSVYVQEELRFFKKIGKADKIIALIVSGEPQYTSPDATSPDANELQCFPDVLRYGVDEDGNILYDHHAEALAADVRLPNSSEEGFTSVEGYRRHLQQQGASSEDIKTLTAAYAERLNLAKLKIIATILGVPLRELTKRDKAYQLERARRKTVIVQRVAAAIGVLAIVATISGIFAWQQKNAAQKNYAQSLYTSGINKLAQNEYGDPAAYIAAAVRSGNQNAMQLAESMLAIRDDMSLLPNLRASNSLFSPSGQYIAGFADLGSKIHVLELWDADTRQKLTEVFTLTARSPSSPFFDAQNRLYAINDQGNIVRYSPTDGKMVTVFDRSRHDAPSNLSVSLGAPVTTNAATTSASSPTSQPSVTATARQPASASAPTTTQTFDKGEDIGYLLKNISPNGDWLALYWYNAKQIELINHQTQQRHFIDVTDARGSVQVHFPQAVTSQQTPTPMAVVSVSQEDQSKLIAIDLRPNADARRTQMTIEGQIFNLNLAQDGRKIAVKSNKSRYYVLDVPSGQTTQLNKDNNTFPSYQALLLAPDNASVLGLSAEGYDVFDTNTGMLISHQAVPLKRLLPMFEENKGLNSYSPDLRQQLTEQNYLLYLRQDEGNPLVVGQYNFPSIYKTIVPSPEGDDWFLLSRDEQNIAKSSKGKITPNFIRASTSIRRLDALKRNRLMTIDDSRTIQFYNADNGQPIGKPLITKARQVIFDRDQQQIAARTGDNGFAIWEIDTGKQVRSYQSPKLENFMLDNSLQTALIANANGWQVVDLTSQTEIMQGQEQLSNALFSEDGKMLAVCNQNNQITVYDLTSKKARFSIPSIRQPIMRFSPDGKTLLASHNNRRLQMWHTADGKPFGQVIPVAVNPQLLTFSDDSSKLFLQDPTENRLNPAVKIIDANTGNLISLPFANDNYADMQLTADQRKLLTVQRDLDGFIASVWQLPTGLDLPKDQLADDLEAFYRRKYDPETGTILPYHAERPFQTWFFQDIYTRSTGPDSQTSVVDAIAGNLPVQDDQQLKALSTAYFYHPLARAGLAEYYSRTRHTAALSQQLIGLTQRQIQRIEAQTKNASASQAMLTKTQSVLEQAHRQQATHTTSMAQAQPQPNPN